MCDRELVFVYVFSLCTIFVTFSHNNAFVGRIFLSKAFVAAPHVALLSLYCFMFQNKLNIDILLCWDAVHDSFVHHALPPARKTKKAAAPNVARIPGGINRK